MQDSEFSYLVAVDEVLKKPKKISLEASTLQKEKIAQRLDLLSLKTFSAEFVLKKQSKLHILMEGELNADVIQKCVRTLDPVVEHIKVPIHELFFLGIQPTDREVDLLIDDDTEPLEAENLDVGEVVIQILSLHLNPFPAHLNSSAIDYVEDKEKPSPFKKLKDIKKDE